MSASGLAVDPVAWVGAALVAVGSAALAAGAAAAAGTALRRRARARGSVRRRPRPRLAAPNSRWLPGALALVGLAAATPGAAAGQAPGRDADASPEGVAGLRGRQGPVSVMRLERATPVARTWLPRAPSAEPVRPAGTPVVPTEHAPTATPAPGAAANPDVLPAATPGTIVPSDALARGGPPSSGPADPGTHATQWTDDGRWTVRPGDHLWGIAEQVIASRSGRPPSDAEVAPYWRALVAANRDRLMDRDNPDLILPGQELVLPPA